MNYLRMRRKIIELNVASFQICMDALPSPTKAGILKREKRNIKIDKLRNKGIIQINQLDSEKNKCKLYNKR